MRHIKKFNESIFGDPDVVLQLTSSEYRLLENILRNTLDERSHQQEDPYANEEELFDVQQRKEIMRFLHGKFADEEGSGYDGDMSVYDYPDYMLARIREENDNNKI